ncbi:MAG: SMP-30/gluconolactonase/LRE family protein, partial [Myxococcales bacterium]|nr:SMP-30/gluconolactonase/LRE family protein [Myxococcales bacterium]
AGYTNGKGTAARFNQPFGLTVDGAGTIFVADTDNSRIRKVLTNGTVSLFSGTGSHSHTDGTATTSRFNRPYGITWANSNLYVADYYNQDIRRVDSLGQTSTITGRQGYGNLGDKPQALSAARFAYPVNTIVDSKGNIYVADRNASRVRMIKLGGSNVCNDNTKCTNNSCVTTTGRCDNGPQSCDDGSACTLDTCTASTGSCVNKAYNCDDGNLCTTDSCDAKKGCKHVLKANCEDCDAAGDCDDGKPCTKDVCSQVTGCAHNPISGCSGCTTAASCDDGNSCTTDTCGGGKCSYKPAAEGTFCSDGSLCTGGDFCTAGQCSGSIATLDYFAGKPGSIGTTDGQGDKARFTVPLGVTWHPGLGQTIVAGGSDHRIRRVLATGQTYRLSGYTAGYKDGSYSSSNTRFNRPADVAVTPDGMIWIADELNHRIRRLDIVKSNLVTTVAGDGKNGFADGKGTAAKLAYPRGIAGTQKGLVIVADSGNHCIREFNPATGVLNTLVGSDKGFADGKATSAKFDTPTGVDVDAQGRIYVADRGNHRIRRVIGNVVTTIAGAGSGYANGLGGKAAFKLPGDVAVNAAGVLFVADTGNHAIRRITQAGQVSTIAGGKGGAVAGALALARLNGPHGISVGAGNTLWVIEENSHTLRKLTYHGSLCGDGKTCHGDACDAKTGLCAYGPAPGSTACDDSNPCTADVCLPWSGNCMNTPMNNGLSCGGGKVCYNGACENK